MARFTVEYEVVLNSSMLVEAEDEDAAAEIVERWVRGGQHLAKPIDYDILDVVLHEDDPQGDW